MKKYITLFVALQLVITAKSQTAMQFSGLDCNGNYVDLFADLDAGKAVVLFYYMDNCGACPPPAHAIQLMANEINSIHPDFVKGYAYPFTNATTCTESLDWTTSNSLDHFYTAMDSGATQVAWYGGFGMPTVVVVGGFDHKVIFTTLSFSMSDTIVMRDSIMSLYDRLIGIEEPITQISSFHVFPAPVSNEVNVRFSLEQPSDFIVELTDVQGKHIRTLAAEKTGSSFTRRFDVADLSAGNYLVQLKVNGNRAVQKIIVTR